MKPNQPSEIITKTPPTQTSQISPQDIAQVPPQTPLPPAPVAKNVSSLDATPERTGVKLPFAQKLVTSGRRILERSGESGTKMAQLLEKQRMDEDLLFGKYNNEVKNALSGLSKEERLMVTDALEGKTVSDIPRVALATQKMRTLLEVHNILCAKWVCRSQYFQDIFVILLDSDNFIVRSIYSESIFCVEVF